MTRQEQEEFDRQQASDYLHALKWAPIALAVIWVLITGFLIAFGTN